MKSLEELNSIRDQAKTRMKVKEDNTGLVRVVVGLATCGIAAGAKPVFETLKNEVAAQNLANVDVKQTGCIGMCTYEPIVEVYTPDKEKVTYIHVDPERVKKIVAEHLVNGSVINEFTIGSAE